MNATNTTPGRNAFLVAVFVLIAAAWILLFAWTLRYPGEPAGFGADELHLVLAPSYLAQFCWSPTVHAGLGAVVSMWGLMSIGMMLPTALPIFSAYHDLTDTQPARVSADNIW